MMAADAGALGRTRLMHGAAAGLLPMYNGHVSSRRGIPAAS